MISDIAPILAKLAPFNARLVAVSKTKPNEAILELYEQGQRVFGENYVQELVPKHESLPKDIEWHFIGRMQSNKVKYIAPFVALIHGVDSLSVLQEMNRYGKKHGRVIDGLLQFFIAQEETKFGLEPAEAEALLLSEGYKKLTHARLCGVMGMATFTEDKLQVRKEFQTLKTIFDDLKSRFFHDRPEFKEISMGMSGDYEIALEEGATMARIGSLLFGKRE